MSSLSLQQTRMYIDKLGDLENELVRSCRVAEVLSKSSDKNQAAAASRLSDACDAARDLQKYVGETKNRLLEFDGFLRAQSHTIRESLSRPHMVSYFNEVGAKMGRAMESHIETIAGEAVEALRRVASAIKDLRDSSAGQEGEASAKASAKALAKICDAAEKAIREGTKERVAELPEHEDEEGEIEVDIEASSKNAHGYTLTAGLPPEFLENAKKKKEEAATKKDDEDEGKKAGEMPDFIQKKIDERGDKKDKDDDEDEGKKAHGYKLTAGLPPEFLENAKKKKEEAAAKKEEDEGKKAHGYLLTADSRTPGNESKGPEEEGEEDEGWVPGHRTKDTGKEAAHGYRLTV